MPFANDRRTDYEIDPARLEVCNNDELIAYVTTFFERKDLRLRAALMEFVLLKDHGIGETYIFGQQKLDYKAFYETYKALVEGFKNKHAGGLATLNDWYETNSWWSLEKGKGHSPHYSDKSHYRTHVWHPKIGRKQISSEYIEWPENREGDLTSFAIAYLDEYANAIKETQLGQYINLCILVKPLSYVDKDANGGIHVQPLGAFYLHFATDKPFDDETLRREFIKDLLLIWYKYYGGILVNETITHVLNQASESETEGSVSLYSYFPKFSSTNRAFDPLIKTYNLFFNNANNRNIYENRISEIENKLFVKLKSDHKIRQPNSNYGWETSTIMKYEGAKGARAEELLKNYSDDPFLLYLTRRLIFCLLFFVFKKDTQFCHKILAKKSALSTPNVSYFWANIRVYIPSNLPSTEEGEESVRTETLHLYSDAERGFVERLQRFLLASDTDS